MLGKFEVPEGYEENLLKMAKRELEYLKDKKQTHGIHFKEDNMIYQLTQFVAKSTGDAQMGNTQKHTSVDGQIYN